MNIPFFFFNRLKFRPRSGVLWIYLSCYGSINICGNIFHGFSAIHSFKDTYRKTSDQWLYLYNVYLYTAPQQTLNFVDQLNYEIHEYWYSMNIDKTIYSSNINKIKISPLAVARKTEYCVFNLLDILLIKNSCIFPLIVLPVSDCNYMYMCYLSYIPILICIWYVQYVSRTTSYSEKKKPPIYRYI